MKSIIKIFFLSIFFIGFSSCDKNENFGFLPYEGTLQFVTPTSGTVIELNKDYVANTGLFLSWVAPNSSTSATYIVEVAPTGTDFETSTILTTTSELKYSMTVEELTVFLLDTLGLEPEEAHSLDFRVSDGSETSDIISIIFTPYRDVYDEMYLVGSINGWTPSNAYPMFNSGENIFTIVLDLPNGAEFKFLPTNTGWDGDWGKDPNNDGQIIQDGESNLSGYAAGQYLVTVNFNAETYSVIPLNDFYLVGSLTGWDPPTSLHMGNASLGVYSLVVDLPASAEFKFLPTNTGWDGDWGKDPNNDGRIIQDGESNVSGYDAGKYVVSINFNKMSYQASSVSSIPSNLYLVGSFNGWSNPSNGPQFIETNPGVFQIIQELSSTDEFKFVPVAGDWGNDWGENPNSKNVLEQNNEVNLKSPGDGLYLITVNFNDGTISVE